MMLARTLLCCCLGVCVRNWGRLLPLTLHFYKEGTEPRASSTLGKWATPEPSVALEGGVPPLYTWSTCLERYPELKWLVSLCHLFAEVIISRIIHFESIYNICIKQDCSRNDLGRPEDPITILWSPAPVQPTPGDFPATQRSRLVWVLCYTQIKSQQRRPSPLCKSKEPLF